MPFLKGVTFSKPSSWVSMLFFGGVYTPIPRYECTMIFPSSILMYHSKAQSLHRNRLVLHPFTPWRRCCKALLQFCILHCEKVKWNPEGVFFEYTKNPMKCCFLFNTPLKKVVPRMTRMSFSTNPSTVDRDCELYSCYGWFPENGWSQYNSVSMNEIRFWLVSWKPPSSGRLCLRLILPSGRFSCSSPGPTFFRLKPGLSADECCN